MAAGDDLAMFRPPIASGMRVLDRAFFQKAVPIKAARVFDNKNISRIRAQLEASKDALSLERLANVYSDPDPERATAGKKCVLLRPEVRRGAGLSNGTHMHLNGDNTNGTNGVHDNSHIPWPHSPILTELVNQNLISIIPYTLHLNYPYWTYHDIISSILPLDAQDEIPCGFAQVGHVAHLNLRDEYLPYKHLIAEIIIDKNATVRTVINKIDDVGEENEFRTFRYEVLAGPDDMNVTLSEEGCTFVFDYSKVYWNTRLQTEHKRLVSLFKEGEAVCDVMAGIGPFAIPAGKKQVFVWANDLNPDSYSSLRVAVKKNKVGDYVRSFDQDGREFIRSGTAQLLDDDRKVEIRDKPPKRTQPPAEPKVLKTLIQPRIFSHYVLNLPASALTFLPSFIGLYPPQLRQKLPKDVQMPIVHVYCFSTKDELRSKDSNIESELDGLTVSDDGAVNKICTEISAQLQYEMKPGSIEEGKVEVYDVRDVAPKKRMFCASFRLPEEVAFREMCRLYEAYSKTSLEHGLR